MSSDKIKNCIEQLPELYQSIFGYPEYQNGASRDCSLRENVITRIVADFQKELNCKKLKVLDIGCAQGYYSFTLQNMGCQVTGVDFCAENIALCHALAEDNGLGNKFIHNKVTKEYIDSLEDDSFDVICIFSVIHHVANENGFEYARDIMETLARKSKIVITELALKEEPYYWNTSLPDSYDRWFDNVVFFNEEAFFETHLSDISRPMVLYSNCFGYLDGSVYTIDYHSKKSFAGKCENINKRYYFSGNKLIKYFRNQDNLGVDELLTEADVCEKYDLSFAPKLEVCKRGEKATFVVYQIEKGENLFDLLKEKRVENVEKIFINVLDNLIELETLGLYHGDIRIWNVCVADKAFLVDFGNVSVSQKDDVAQKMNPNVQYTAYDALMALIYDVLAGNVYDTIGEYEIYSLSYYYDIKKIEKNYQNFFVWYMLNKNELSFALIKEMFCKYVMEHKNYETDKNVLEVVTAISRRVYADSARMSDVRILEKKSYLYTNSLVDGMTSAIKNSNQQIDKLGKDMLGLSTGIQNNICTTNENVDLLSKANAEVNLHVQKLYQRIDELQSQTNELQSQIKDIREWAVLRGYEKIRKFIRRK